MKTNYFLASSLCIAIATTAIHAADLEPIFNGKDLTGWHGLPGYWTVEDGAIVGETTKQTAIDANTFLIWDGGDVADFEFGATVRFKGNNSGVQYRSQVIDEKQSSLMGYQMDLHPSANFFGMLYGEKYGDRGKIATRGQRIEIDAAGTVNRLGDVGNKHPLVDWQWNTVRIIAVGNRLIHQVGGVTTIDVTDNHKDAIAHGLLGLQLHKGPPMRVEFKDVQLRSLKPGQGKRLLEEFASGAAPETPTTKVTKPGRKRTADLKTESGFNVAKGFKVGTVYAVDADSQGSWVALTIDDKGRFIASDQGDKGLFRVAVDGDDVQVEKLPVDLSGAQGLLWKSSVLYASISGEGLNRATASIGDGNFDQKELLSAYFGKGEHGNHALVDTEDSESIFAVSGNQTPLPAADTIARRHIQSYEEDLLLPRQWDPRGHARGIFAPGGWITRFDPVTKTHDLFCSGFRNEYDVALNANGDLFTYDADMEWDLGLPWYRPTRICFAVSGGDYGWRSGSGKWPTYYEDSLPPVVEIGPGSPTGVISGRGTKFPEKYQHAIYALDWTYGRILAIHVRPHGAGYVADVEEFVSAPALPVTDAVVGSDGALYFTTGGRGAKSELMRIVYTGKGSTEPAQPPALPVEAITRRELEAFHGVNNASAIAVAWPHLSSPDRFLRHAARVAIESQAVDSWASKVFNEANSQARITAAVALARMGSPEHHNPLLECLLALDERDLTSPQLLGLLRAFALTMDRLGKPTDSQREALIAKLDPLLPSSDPSLNTELLRVLAYLQSPTVVAKGMQLIAAHSTAPEFAWGAVAKMNERYGATLNRLTQNPPPSDAILYAFLIRNAQKGWTPDLRRQYFSVINAAGKANGGASYPGYLTNLREEVLANCTNDERLALADLTGEDFNPVPDFPIEPPVGPGKAWSLKEAMTIVDEKPKGGFDFERGRSLFHAVNCGACHRFAGLGGGVGPDLTSVPNKFDAAYLVEAIINPSKNISDQYQSSTVLLESGQVLMGLVVEDGADTILVYPPDVKVAAQRVARDNIEVIKPSSISQMPVGLIDKMNADELGHLMAYILSGGNPDHKPYGPRGELK